MKKAFTYSAIVLLLAATACNKTDSDISGNGQIRFALTSPGTRALVKNETDLQAQTIKVFDFLDGTNYFDADETVSYASGAWKFDSGKGYTWKTGSHRFFAYTNGAGTLGTDNKVTVSKTLTTAAADQLDIVYSGLNITKTKEEAAADNYKAVSLNMDHLFAAVSINVMNCTDKNVFVAGISKVAIPNVGSATLDFTKPSTGADSTKVTYGAVTTDGDFVSATALTNGNVTLKPQKYYDVLQMDTTSTKAYQLVWPQTIAENQLSVTVKYKYGAETEEKQATVMIPAGKWEAGNKYDITLQILPTDIKLVFVVMMWEGVPVEVDTETGSINMSNVTWQNAVVTQDTTATPIQYLNTLNNGAYSVYMYHKASIQVIKRDSSGDPIHEVYATETVGADGVTYPAGAPVVDENGEANVYVKVWKEYDYYPAQGYFTVNYPKSGKYRIGLIPAYGETQVDTTKYEVYIYDLASQDWKKHNRTSGESISNKTVYFQVRASSSVPATHSGYKAQIDIWFKADGSDEWVSAYSEIRANYACVIPAVSN